MNEKYRYQTLSIYQRLEALEGPFPSGGFSVLCSLLGAFSLMITIGPEIARANKIPEEMVYAAIFIGSLLIGFIVSFISSHLKTKKLKSETFKNETKQLLFERFSENWGFDIAIENFDHFANKHPKDSEFQTLYGQYLSHIAVKNQSQNAVDDFYRLHQYVECFDENKYRAEEKLRKMNFSPIQNTVE